MSTANALQMLERELRGIFGARLQSLVAYGERMRAGSHRHAHGHDAPPVPTLAVVDTLSGDDLRACAGRIQGWHDSGLATPLLLASHEFGRSLDAFPLEFGAILADYALVAGADPFVTLKVDPADLRRAVEVQARSHLLHLREGYLETRGRSDALAVLIVASAPAFSALMTSVARLQRESGADAAAAARHVERQLSLPPGAAADVVAVVGVAEISSADADRLFPPYLDAVEKLVGYVDRWS